MFPVFFTSLCSSQPSCCTLFQVGAAQPFFQCTPPLLSATWFGTKERSLATAVAINFNQVTGSWYSMIAGRMMGDDSSLKLVAPVHAPFLHFLALVLRRIATIIFVIRTHETLLQVGIGSAFLLGGFMATDAEGLATYFAVISSLSLVSQRRLVNIISMHAKRLQSCSLPLCVSRHCLKSTNHLDSSTL